MIIYNKQTGLGFEWDDNAEILENCTTLEPIIPKDGTVLAYSEIEQKWIMMPLSYEGQCYEEVDDKEGITVLNVGQISIYDCQTRPDWVKTVKKVNIDDYYFDSSSGYHKKDFDWYGDELLTSLKSQEQEMRSDLDAHYFSKVANIALDCNQEALKNIEILIEQMTQNSETHITFKGYNDGEFVRLTLEQLTAVKHELNAYFVSFKHKRWYLKYIMLPNIKASSLTETNKIKKLRNISFDSIESPDNFDELLADKTL